VIVFVHEERRDRDRRTTVIVIRRTTVFVTRDRVRRQP
jgi:hypothetical protein